MNIVGVRSMCVYGAQSLRGTSSTSGMLSSIRPASVQRHRFYRIQPLQAPLAACILAVAHNIQRVLESYHDHCICFRPPAHQRHTRRELHEHGYAAMATIIRRYTSFGLKSSLLTHQMLFASVYCLGNQAGRLDYLRASLRTMPLPDLIP